MIQTVLLAITLSLIILRVQSFITLRNGYFYDEDAQKIFIPHGIAYQCWFGNYGLWETAEQIESDLREMKSINVNSLRVDFRWADIEMFRNHYDFSKYDLLVQLADKYDIKLFPLLGALGIPNWAPGKNLTGQEGNDLDPGWMTVSNI